MTLVVMLPVTLCSLVAGLTKYDKGKTVTHPFSNYTVVMFVQGYVTVFLGLCDLDRKGPPQRLLRLTAFLEVIMNYFQKWFIDYTNCDIMKIQKCHQRELGSSLPIMGGGGCYD